MKKGVFGLNPSAIAVIAFGFAALREPTAVLLVCGFALLAEKDKWLNKQTMQALLLTITYYLTTLVTNWLFGGIERFFGWSGVNGIQMAISMLNTFIGDLVYLALIIFCVIAILRVIRGKDAALPFIEKIVDGHLTTSFDQESNTKATPADTAPSVQPSPVEAQYTPPVQPAIEVQLPAANEVKVCAACNTPLQKGLKFCTECGVKVE